ncbi:hypothetical protein LEP1GSC037_5082 [Leptospira interrogans str. 2006001854]|uniref:Uncharacterized protein n=1 Tax=Leptospira interrogans str. 2006001854 TaxID=1001590 RepID=M6GEU9_LEPIR|nr:hypothetical protein LEP1GSC037_5082 [Leptospira interrogans str. 2006001854]
MGRVNSAKRFPMGRVNSAKRFPMGRVLGRSMIVFDYKLKLGKDFVFN